MKSPARMSLGTHMDFLSNAFVWLNTETGINLPFLYDPYYRGKMVRGINTTILLAIWTILFSLLIGGVGVWLQGSANRLVRGITNAYIQLFRNTPPLVQLYFFYFVLSALLPRVPNDWGGTEPLIGAFGWAVISLSLFAGAFNIEIFRSGVEAVPGATHEAAASLGFSKLQIFSNVTFPLAFRFALPALTNNLVNLVKSTTLAYAIAVPDMLYEASEIWAENINVLEMMIFLLVGYYLLVGMIVKVMTALERKLHVPGLGQ